LLTHMATGTVYNAALPTSVPSVWSVVTANATEHSLLVVNANLTQALNLSLTSLIGSGKSTTQYSWQPGQAHPTVSAGTADASVSVPPQGILLVNFGATLAASLAVSASANVTSGTAPLTVGFSASASGGSGLYSYSWNLGDGASGTGAAVSHTYSTAGQYRATVTVTDALGVQGSASISIGVVSPIASLAVTARSNVSGGTAPLAVALTASASGGTAPYSYSWDFGNGAGSLASAPSTLYSLAGNYTATVTVADSGGSVVRAAVSIDVVNSPSSLAASVSSTGATGEAPFDVVFSSTVFGGSAPYAPLWSFGDGTAAAPTRSVEHVFDRPGTYSVRFSVTDAASTSVVIPVLVAVYPALAVSIVPGFSQVATGTTVPFHAVVSGGHGTVLFAWNASGTASCACEQFNWTAPNAGSFDILLFASDAQGGRATASSHVIVSGLGQGNGAFAFPAIPWTVVFWFGVPVGIGASVGAAVARRRARRASFP
jgi:PKD repeat protein